MLWVINILICWVALRASLRRKSVLVIFWAYGLYMGLIGAAKYLLHALPISNGLPENIGRLAFFVAANGAFFAASEVYFRVVGAPGFTRHQRAVSTKFAESGRRRERLLLVVYAAFYIFGVTLYLNEALNLNYEAFVNYEGSAWSQVLFYGGASVISLVAARSRPLFAIALALPYVFLAVGLGIRSFLALSIFPVLIVLAFTGNRNETQATAMTNLPQGNLRSKPAGNLRRRVRVVFASIAALLVVFWTLHGAAISKTGQISLPEESLVEYYFTVAEATERGSVIAATESIERFFWGLGSPILKQLGIRYEKDGDPQAVFATYIDDYAGRLDQYFHYPSLWQADVFAALGYWGVALAPFWAVTLLSIERLASRGALIWRVSLPVLCWITFMFSRGAIGNATISVSYVILLHVAVLGSINFLFSSRSMQRLRRGKVRHVEEAA